MTSRKHVWLALLFLTVFAVSRWPGLFPANFSVTYALAFCAGVYFQGASAWWLPLGAMVVTDIGLNFYYQSEYPESHVWDLANLSNLALNYLGYVVLIFLGRRFKSQSAFLHLLAGGILGAILFYLITNTASWLFNPYHSPEYTRTLHGWLLALTRGINGYPPTWEFFRNTLFSGGLFTALFVAAEKTATAESPADKVAGAVEQDEPKEPSEEAIT